MVLPLEVQEKAPLGPFVVSLPDICDEGAESKRLRQHLQVHKGSVLLTTQASLVFPISQYLKLCFAFLPGDSLPLNKNPPVSCFLIIVGGNHSICPGKLECVVCQPKHFKVFVCLGHKGHGGEFAKLLQVE